jgi:predicted glycoside hydrolase/deacetylase ChbG (UPF0249 family)
LSPLPKYLVVNADDFGFTHDVNAGIIEALESGILRAATLMANGDAFEDAVKLARAHPNLDVGCHLVLVQGRSVARPGTALPGALGELMSALARRRLDPFEELRAQVLRILDAGVRPTHLDTHKHTHLLPSVLEAVARLSEEFGIPWVRRPFDFPLRGGAAAPWPVRVTSRGIGVLRGRFHSVLARYGCRTTDHFAGFRITGRLHTRQLLELVRQLPDGSTELMCHPGHCTDELRAARTRLKESRAAELDALRAPEVRAAIEEAEVRVVSYRELDGNFGKS